LKKLKVVYLISDLNQAFAFEWIAESLKTQCHLDFILIGHDISRLQGQLEKSGVSVQFIPCSSKIQLVPVFFRIVWSFLLKRPNVVHTHLQRANLVGLSAAWMLRVKKRIYTRHHAMVHHLEYPRGIWLDKWINYIATDIVSISQNISFILRDLERVPTKKIRQIHHGFDLAYFRHANKAAIAGLIDKFHLTDSMKPIVGVVARYQQWKGIQYIIPAFNKTLQLFPKAHLVLANAHGSYEMEIRQMLQQLPPYSFTEIAFEDDASSLFKLFDVYVHVPIDEHSEAFGQTYIEALASGIPSIFTLSGVATEFIKDAENALVVPFRDSEGIYQAMIKILNSPDLRNHLIANGQKSADQFPLSKMIDQLRSVYES
jgi:glycosyltransferase involved in cell wall biosynthesis